MRFDEISFRSFHPETATSDLAKRLNRSEFKLSDQFYHTETIVNIKGNLLGKTAMTVRLVPVQDWSETNEPLLISNRKERQNNGEKKWLDVWVVRSAESRRLTKYFVFSVVILISLANVMMGCEVGSIFEISLVVNFSA